MKKLIVSVLAAGALGFGAAASAQDLGSVLSNILGAVTGQAQTPVYVDPYGRQVYTDQYGRQVYLDPYGQQVLVQPRGEAPRHHGVVGHNEYGQPIYGWIPDNPVYGTYGTYAYADDRDRDGVPNAYDRYPDDSRYR